MDVDHVAFAAPEQVRRPPPAPADCRRRSAQIAGRAGRGMRDGTFGTTGDCPPLAGRDRRRGREPQLRAAADRCAGATASSISPASTRCWTAWPRRRPCRAWSRGHDAADLHTLSMLAREPEIRAPGARAARRVRLLWEACQMPDFRKLADDTHTALCAPRLRAPGARTACCRTTGWPGRSPHWPATEGDIDTLMQRLADIRVWSYIAARADWVPDAPALAGRGPQGRGLLFRRAARTADRPLRRPPRRPSDAPAGRRPRARTCSRPSPARARWWSRAIPSARSTASFFHPEAEARPRRSASSCCAPPAARCGRRCRAASPPWRPPRTTPSPDREPPRHLDQPRRRAGRDRPAARSAPSPASRRSRCWRASSSTAPSASGSAPGWRSMSKGWWARSSPS